MANYFTRFLNGAITGLTNPKGQMANWQHATKLYVNESFRLAPRTKFMFYVKFNLNKSVLKSPAFTARHADEIGMLVKSAQLPGYTFETETKNQYNKKKIVYKSITYDPVTLTLHDDNAGIINAMWALYYGYYVADRNQPDSAYTKGGALYRPVSGSENAGGDFRYGLDNDISAPFFESVSVYTMSRSRFLGYTLINPKIKAWTHGDADYAEGGVLDSSMTLEYESVKYSAGIVSRNNPTAFAVLHYDTVPSPLSVAGGGTATLTGPGGVLTGLETIFGGVASGGTFGSLGGLLGTAIVGMNTYHNMKGITGASLEAEAANILSNPANVATAVNLSLAGVSGIAGAIFPVSVSANEVVLAGPKLMTTR